jgi:hypothetical protein
VEVAIRVRVSLRLRLASLLLCSALPRSPPRLAGSGLAGRPPTFGLSCFPCQLPPLGLVRHWPLAGFRKAETHKTTRGQSALFRVQAQPTRSLFDCAVWTVEELYASERSASRGPALHRVGSAMLAARGDHLENGCCSISIMGTRLAWVVFAFVRRQMLPEEKALRDASSI